MTHSIFGWSLPPGCHSVPGDEPHYEQITTRVHRAAHETVFRCENCGDRIQKGQLYRYELFKDEDGQLAAFRTHVVDCTTWPEDEPPCER
jgi:hypothetical protein